MAIRLELEITVDDKGAVTAVKRVGDEADKTTGKMKETGKQGTDSLESIAKKAAMAYLSWQTLSRGVQFATDCMKEAAEAERNFVRLDSVVKATGGSAGFTAIQMAEMATQMQRTTVYTDDAVLKAQAMLATFKNISGDTFPRTIRAAADLAEVMETDLGGAVSVLGRALESPEQGMMALRRAGIIFTESEKAHIKALSDANQMLEAQAVILDKVEEKVRGAAAAAGATADGEWTRFTNQIGEAKENLGGLVTKSGPVLFFLGSMRDALDVINTNFDRFADRMPGVIGGLASIQKMGQLAQGTSSYGLGAPLPGKDALSSALPDMNLLAAQGLAITNSIVTPIRDVSRGASEAAKSLMEMADGFNAGTAGIDAFTAKGATLEDVFSSIRRQPAEISWTPIPGGEGSELDPFSPVGMAASEAAWQTHMNTLHEITAQSMAQIGMTMAATMSQFMASWDAAQGNSLARGAETLKFVGAMAGQIAAQMNQQDKKQFESMKELRKMEVAMNVASGIMNVWDKWGYLPYVAAAFTALIVAQGAMQMSAINSMQFKGQAHSGLDSVPSTGTYLLEQGEAVIPKYRNVPGYSGGGGGTQLTINAYGTWRPSDSELYEILSRSDEARDRGRVN